MGALDWLAGKLGFVRPSRARGAGYAAAEHSRLTASLVAEAQYINTTLRYQLRALRARSRHAAQNNPYARRFAQMVVDNVCGPQPFRLQAKVKINSGKLNDRANRAIEEEWRGWGRKGACEISGRWSWNALQRLLIRTLCIDGELLLRRHRGPEYGAYGYQLQLVDIDRLDDLKNKKLEGGGAIHMGVEVDAANRPVAYHILKRKPSDWAGIQTRGESERVPADDVLHLFVPDFAEQVRGVPWIYAALLNLVHLGAFEEAAVIAARIGAAQMGVIESPDGGATLANTLPSDASGAPTMSAEPGEFKTLPPGYKMSDGWDPKYPDAAIGPFVKSCLRGISVGVGVAYHNLSGDMEGVNYSSARIAELDERDGWMTIQNFVAEHLHDDIYADWLRMSIMSGKLALNYQLVDSKYREIYWQARRWGWVDPEKEVSASLKAIDGRLKSRTRVISEGGEDIEDVFDEIAAEEQLAKDKKVTLGLAAKPAADKPVEPAQPADGANPDENNQS